MLKLLTAAARAPTPCVGRCFSVLGGEESCAVSKLAPPMSTEASLYVHVSKQPVACKWALRSCEWSVLKIRLNAGGLLFKSYVFPQWPYCLRRCSYCNFNKYIHRSDNNAVMSDCLQRETETVLRLSGVSWYVMSCSHLSRSDPFFHAAYRTCNLLICNSSLLSFWCQHLIFYSITSVFFGGGTPSLAHPSTVAAVLETVAKHAGLSDKAEVTLEVNPTPMGKSRLEDFLLAGVNRFSIGVQVSGIFLHLLIWCDL